MSEIELQKLRSDVEVLKKRLDRLKASNEQDYYDVLDPPVATATQELVTNVRVNADELRFEKKTRTAVCKFTDQESSWQSWHVGTTCSNGEVSEAMTGEDVSAFASTLALMRLTGAI